MITKSVLDRAKGFLCWDMFPKLTIQLIGQRNSVAYFYPPSNMFGSIIVFYNADIKDFQEPLFPKKSKTKPLPRKIKKRNIVLANLFQYVVINMELL